MPTQCLHICGNCVIDNIAWDATETRRGTVLDKITYKGHRRHTMTSSMEKFSALLALCEGNPPVDSPHKGQWCGVLMFCLICAWTNGWAANNRDTCDMRRLRAHHDVTCITHVPWCMSGSLTSGGGENVLGIPGACATRNFAYLVRGPYRITSNRGTRTALLSLWVNCSHGIARLALQQLSNLLPMQNNHVKQGCFCESAQPMRDDGTL